MTGSHRTWRAAWAATGVAVGLLLAGCGEAEPDRPAGAPERTQSPAEKAEPAKEAFDAFGPEFGALSTILAYCTPGLPGSPREGCDLDRLRKGVTELTVELEKKLDAPGAAGTYPHVAAAVDELEKANSELEPCGEWYEAGAELGRVENWLACDEAWTAFHHDFDAVTAAAGYGRKR